MERPAQSEAYGYNLRAEIAPFLPVSARRALDVGAGKGGFGETLRRVLGPDAHLTAVDAVASHVTSIREAGHYDEVLHGYFPDDVPPAEPYDLVTFLDVLEHMVDPWTIVAETLGWLVEGGVVVASLPNVASWPIVTELIRGRWDYRDSGVLDRTHLRFFTRATMSEMFERAGYNLLGVHGINRVSLRPTRGLAVRLVRPILPNLSWPQFVVVAQRLT